MSVADNVIPEERWAFDQEVAQCFDNMLQRSIPQYNIMRDVVVKLSKRFIKSGSCIIDIGCSRGESIEQIFQQDAFFYGLECSPPMIQVATDRFISEENVVILDHDLRKGIPIDISSADLILSVLTIQFVPIEYRQGIFQAIYDKLNTGSAFILIEKVLGANATIDSVMVDTYLQLKKNNGYSEEQIRSKKLALEGVLVPVTAAWNEELLKMAGFKSIDCVWRWMNFAGWIAIK